LSTSARRFAIAIRFGEVLAVFVVRRTPIFSDLLCGRLACHVGYTPKDGVIGQRIVDS
jgi:hypothetical protein